MNWLIFIEPYNDENDVVYKIIHKNVAIKTQKQIAEKLGKPYKDDETALQDFMAVNWAKFCSDPRSAL